MRSCAANRSASCHVKEQRCIIIISTIRANHCPPPSQPCNCTAAIIVTITIITVINSLVALVSLLSFFPFLLILVFYFLLGFGLCYCCCWLGLDAKLSYFQRAKPSQKSVVLLPPHHHQPEKVLTAHGHSIRLLTIIVGSR